MSTRRALPAFLATAFALLFFGLGNYLGARQNGSDEQLAALRAEIALLKHRPTEAAGTSGNASRASLDPTNRAAIVGNCIDVTGPHGLTAEVTNDMGYVPSVTVTVQVRQIAKFAYADDGTEHTIVSGPAGAADGLFASAPFSTHGSFTCIRFDAPGSYPVHCDRHPNGAEQGTITVAP